MEMCNQAREEIPRSHDGSYVLMVVLATGAAVSLGCYVLLPRIAAGLALAEPSFAYEVFGWVTAFTKDSLTKAQEAGAFPNAPVRFLTLCLGLFAIYFIALRSVRGVQSAKVQALVFGAGTVFLLAQLFSPILLSSDLYVYAYSGRVLAIYGANPYGATTPNTPADPFLPLFGQGYSPSVYGPIWNLIAGGVAFIGGAHVGVVVLLFRLTAIAATLGTAALLWSVLRRTRPERTTQGLVLFLWNPLVMMEFGMSAHNDAVMLFFVALALWLHVRGWKSLATVALVASALVKLVTIVLVPLYAWMALRQPIPWRQRGVFLMRALAESAVVFLVAATFSRQGMSLPAAQVAGASSFYDNSLHDLVVRGLRRWLGEDTDTIGASYYFQGWWLAAKKDTEVWSATSGKSEAEAHLHKDDKVFVCAPQQTLWARVYLPGTGRKGYVDTSFFEEATRPASAENDPKLIAIEAMVADWPTVRAANRWLRVVTWSLFAAFGLWAAWRTKDFESFVVWSAAALIASYYLVFTQFWPWYVCWALAVGAVVPNRLPANFAIALSAGVLTLYVTIGFQGGSAAWVYTYRSLPAFLLPLALFVILWGRAKGSRTQAA